MIPVSNIGRCITVTAMLMGVIVIALPITVVGSTFSATYAEMKGDVEQDHYDFPEPAFLMTAVKDSDEQHAHLGFRGAFRPTRMKERMFLSGEPVLDESGPSSQCSSVSSAVEDPEQGDSSARISLHQTNTAVSQVECRSSRRPSLSQDLHSVKV